MAITSYLNRLACLLTIAFPVLLIVGSAAADIAMSVIAVLFIVHSYIQKDWGWCRDPWVRALALLWLYMIVRGLFAEYPLEAAHRSLPFGRYFIFSTALAYWTFTDEATRRRFFIALTIVVLFLALDGLMQWLTGRDILLHDILIDSTKHLRLTGPFRSPMLGIMLAWLSFPVCLQLAMTEGGTVQRGQKLITGLAALLLVILVTALSGERMALLLTLLGWTVIILLLPIRKRYLLAILGGAVALLALLAFVSPMVFERQILSTINTLHNWRDSPYGLLFASDVRVAEMNPIFGIGANHFRFACPTLYAATPDVIGSVCNIHPHNIYLELLIENGVIGLGLFIACIAAIAIKCLRHWHLERNNPVFIGLLAALFIRLWPIASSTGFCSRWGAPPFWLIVGAVLFYATGKQQEEKKKGESIT